MGMTSVPPDQPTEPQQPPQPPEPPQPQDPPQPQYSAPQYVETQPQYAAQAPAPVGYSQPAAQYPQAYPPQYGYAAAAPRTNVLAIIALVLSLISVSIGGVITGHIALSQIKKTGEQGRGLALAGLIIGYIGSAGWVLFWVFLIVAPLIFAATMATTMGSLDYSGT
ncbi:hypothetical protein ASC63_07840 [Leifsonia sp. Root112D2]|nr:hypothetical protein ASC63_07840 [Leifsonia sp. Root112D2]